MAYYRDELSGGLRVSFENPTEFQQLVMDDTNALLALGGAYERNNHINYTGIAYPELLNLIMKEQRWREIEKLTFDAVLKYADKNNQENWNFFDNDVALGGLRLMEAAYIDPVIKEKKLEYIHLNDVRRLIKVMEQVKELTIINTEKTFNLK